jgi:hypothetical protein
MTQGKNSKKPGPGAVEKAEDVLPISDTGEW